MFPQLLLHEAVDQPVVACCVSPAAASREAVDQPVVFPQLLLHEAVDQPVVFPQLLLDEAVDQPVVFPQLLLHEAEPAGSVKQAQYAGYVTAFLQQWRAGHGGITITPCALSFLSKWGSLRYARQSQSSSIQVHFSIISSSGSSSSSSSILIIIIILLVVVVVYYYYY